MNRHSQPRGARQITYAVRLGVVLFAPFAGAALYAQSAAPTAADLAKARGDTPKKSGEVITLEAFTVNTDKDDGFLATNAGTATKLGLDMKDLAAPYSVMTGEFIQAMGLTDLQSATMWATNGAPVLDGQGADLFGGSGTSTTSSMYSIRGVILNAGQQRNFFLTSGIGDTYNIERIDFGRGPNGVLFNVGANDALGGGISTVGKRARFDRNSETISVMGGSWDYYRTTLDVNRVLSDRLAVRANMLYQKRNGWLQQETDNRKGFTLGATYKFGPKTEIRAEVVGDRVERSRVPIPYMDNLSGWDGKTVAAGLITNDQLNGLAPLPNGQYLQRGPNSPTDPKIVGYQGSPEGVWRLGTTYIFDPTTNSVMNWANTLSTRRGDENPLVPIYIGDTAWSRNNNGELLPFGNAGSAGGNLTPGNNSQGGGQDAFYDMINLPANRFDRQMANSHFKIPSKRFGNMPNDPLFVQTTQDVNLAFTHQVGDSLFFEVSGDMNRVKEQPIVSHLGFRNTAIDINKLLPNGQPNPHFLDAFGESDIVRDFRVLDNFGGRAALGYVKDFGRWGNYTFNLSGSYNGRSVEYRRRQLNLANQADPREWINGGRIRLRNYWSDSDHEFQGVNPTSLFDTTWATNGNSYTSATTQIKPRWILANWQDRKESTTSGIFAFAARFFNNRVILSPGIRVDRQFSYFRDKPTSFGFLPVDPNWDGLTLTDAYWRPDAPADWKTLMYIPKNADGSPRSAVPIPAFGNRPTLSGPNGVNPANPVYANDRFRGDYNNPKYKNTIATKTAGLTYHAFRWMAIKLNYSEGYKPGDTGRFTLNGDDAKQETGVAYEAGITFSAFQDRLVVTPRYYFNRKENRLGDPPTTGPINNLMNAKPWDDASVEFRNHFGYTNVMGGDYFATRNNGVEFEVNGRITKGWRIMGNFGTGQVVDYDRWKKTRAYVLGRNEEFVNVLKAAGGKVDTTQKITNAGHDVTAAPGLAIADPAITDAMIAAAGGSTVNRTNAINNFNNIWVQYDNIGLLKDTVGLKRMKINLFTDYTIQRGTLRGLRLGLGWQYVDQDRAGYRSGDTVLNPAFNPNLAVSATNRPWMDDPSVDVNTPVWTKRPSEFRGTLAYSWRLHSGYRILRGKEMDVQLNIINLTNRHDVYYQDDGVALRPPNGDYSQPYRVAVPSRIASFQRPISFEFTATLKL